MSTDESLGSHQLNSFSAFLEENLHTSSETSKVQSPQVRKMADGKRPQKGGKRPETNIAFEIPEDIYAHLMKQLMAKTTRISTKCASRGLRGDGLRNGGNTAMLLPST